MQGSPLELENLATIEGLTGITNADASAIVRMMREDPAGARDLFLGYKAAAADGTPDVWERAWAIFQMVSGIVVPLVGDITTVAGLASL
jgi:hypothetical protein